MVAVVRLKVNVNFLLAGNAEDCPDRLAQYVIVASFDVVKFDVLSAANM